MGILAFFVLLFTVRIRVTIEMKDELSLTVLAFGIKLRILPKKPKKYKLRSYTLKKIAKRDKKAAAKAAKKAAKKKAKQAQKDADKQKKQDEESRLTKAEKKAAKAKKQASRPPLPDTISLLLSILRFFFSGLFGRIHFHVARIRIGIGSADAATTAFLWCAVSTALKPILMFLDKHSNLHGMRNADIKITTDYLSSEIKADVKLAFSMSIGGLLGVLLRAGFKFIFGWVKIKPSVPKDKESQSPASEGKKAQKAEIENAPLPASTPDLKGPDQKTKK